MSQKIMQQKMLPHTIRNNFLIWATYDWSQLGEEWVPSAQWKQTFMTDVLGKYYQGGGNVLEVGPGAGEWSKELVTMADRLILVDLVPRCIEICKLRFSDYNHIDYHVNDGEDISFVADNSVDLVFAMDVFVQVSFEVTAHYMQQFANKLKPNGLGILHHPRRGTSRIGWRSEVSDANMRDFCAANNFEVINQITTWDNGRQHIWPGQDIDSVTIFKKL